MSETPASPFLDPLCSFTSLSRESANLGPRKLWVLSRKKKKMSKKEIPCRQPSSGEEEENMCNAGDGSDSEDESESGEEHEDVPLAQFADEEVSREANEEESSEKTRGSEDNLAKEEDEVNFEMDFEAEKKRKQKPRRRGVTKLVNAIRGIEQQTESKSITTEKPSASTLGLEKSHHQEK